MKTNILLVANGDIESDLDVIDAAARTAHGVRRASARSRPSQVLQKAFADSDAVIIDLDNDGQPLGTVEALGCDENAPPVIVLTNPQMAPIAYRHGATACVIKPFTAGELASVITNLCLHVHPFDVEHPVEAISIATPRSTLRQPPD
jgi:AmiR/NasT family two-component response regulator